MTRANATRETRRRAKAREEYVGFFWEVAFARAVVDVRARADDDGPSTERRPNVDRAKRHGCRSERVNVVGVDLHYLLI